MTDPEKRQAYMAMFAFLEEHWKRTQSDDFGLLLSSMSLLEDGSPADSAVWQDWMKATERASLGKVDAELRLTRE